MSRPSNRIFPPVGSISLVSSRAVVVLPQPDSPQGQRLARSDREVEAVNGLDRSHLLLEQSLAHRKVLDQTRDGQELWGLRGAVGSIARHGQRPLLPQASGRTSVVQMRSRSGAVKWQAM